MAFILLKNPEAQQFASQLCQRIGKLIEAYRKIEEEHRPTQNTRQPGLNSILCELKDKLAFARFFGNTAMGGGSIGYNPLTIQKVVKEGSLREQMTLAYCTVFSFLLDEVLKDEETIRKVNEKLKEMKVGFQLNVELIEKERKEIGSLICPIERVTKFRNIEKARLARPQPHIGEEPKGLKLSEIPGLTLSEARAGLEEYISQEEFEAMQRGEIKGKKLGERRIKWMSGSDYWKVGEESTFAKEVKSLGLGSSAMLAGPSGTSDGFLHVAKYMGLENSLKQGVMALIGWMVPTRDHSMHEVLIAASDYILSYKGKPEDFDHLFDETIMEQVRSSLHAQGYQMPSYYLLENHQRKVADQLGLTLE